MHRFNALIGLLFVAIGTQAHGEVVLDADDNAATFTGTWAQSTAALGYYGTDFASATGAGSADTARFFSPRPITSTGAWCVQARWTAGTNRTTAARYQVFDGATLRNTFIINQQLNGGSWRRLGCVTLSAGSTSEVRLTDTGVAAANVVIADGIRWVWEETPGAAADFCIAVNGGWGAGGTTFVGKSFSLPASGTCRPWAGLMKTATTVVGMSAGSACVSSDGKVITASLHSTAPSFLGAGTSATDHIELCTSLTGCPVAQADRGTFGGPAARKTCSAADSAIPSVHD